MSESKKKVPQQQEEEPFYTVVDNVSTNYKKILTKFVESAKHGIHSSINSLQSIDILQKIPHVHEIPSFTLTEDDLFAPITEKFLGDYSLEDIDCNFNKYGITKGLGERGYKDIIVSFDTSDYFVHKLSVSDKSLLNTTKNHNGQFLIDLFIRKKDFVVSDFKSYQLLRRIETHYKKENIRDKQIETIKYVDGLGAMEVYKFMENKLKDKYLLSLIEWICMQDPHSKFSQNKPQFPGQNNPGLRIGRQFGNMLIDLAIHKGRDGLSNIPEYFHNAYLYHMQHYTFLNPAFQAYFDCLCDSLADDIKVHGLSAVSWAFCNGHVINRNGEMEIWNPEEQVYPTSSKLRLYFASRDYKRLYNIFRKRGYQVSIDWENAKEIWHFSLNHELSEATNHFCEDTAEDIAVEHHQNEEEYVHSKI